MMWILALSLFQFLISFSHLNFLVPLEAISETINSNSINDDILSQLRTTLLEKSPNKVQRTEANAMDVDCGPFMLSF